MVLNRTTQNPLLASSMLSRSQGGRQNSSLPVKAPVKRRGFGLFSDDEDDGENTGDEAESKRLSVSFSGNKSGFEVIEKVKGKGRMSMDGTDFNTSQPMSASFPVYTPPKTSGTLRNSRNSSLTTPKRSGRAPRSTPYSTTTSRALQRAKASQSSNVENHEDQLIADTSYEELQEKSSPYSMHGAKVYDDDEEPTDEDPVDGSEEYGFRVTPTRNIFTKVSTPVKTPTKSPKGVKSPPATGKKTWGQWLGAILPESVKKPVKAILGTPEDDMEANVITPTKELVIGTPKKDIIDEDHDGVYSLPGSFGKPEPQRPSQPLLNEFNSKGTGSNSSGFNISKSFGSTSTRVNDSGLFVYDKPKALTTTAPSRRERRSTMSTPIKASKAASEVSSLRKPNNFIERMRSTKKTQRYDPYTRKISATKEKIELTKEEEKELTPEEKLRLFKQRQKERKIAELEEKYELRETFKASGQPIPDEDEFMLDSDTEVSKDKGKGKEKRTSLNATVEEASEPTTLPIAPGSPPKSPIKKTRESPTAPPSRNLFSPSMPAPSFLLNPDTAPAEIPFKINTAPPPGDAPTINFNSAPSSWSFTSDSSDKENISDGPPPPPTMSHATLPAPLTASASPSQPPVLSGGLFGSQPAGGFGLGPPKELTPFQRQKNAAEKFKPVVSSSLRESRLVADEDEKENVPDKENAGESSKKGEGEIKKRGLSLSQQGQSSGSAVFAKPALKENAGVLNLGKSEVKVDIRAKVEAIPTKQLVSAMVWPVDTPFGSQVIKDAVANIWIGRLGEYPSGFGELFTHIVKV